VQLQGIAVGLYLCSSGLVRTLKLVLSCVQCAPGLPNFTELEDSLNLFRALGRLHEDEAENLATRKRNFRMVGDFRESSLHVIVSWLDLGLLGRCDLAGDRRRFADPGKKDPQRDERRVGTFCLVNVGAVFRNRKVLCPPTGFASKVGFARALLPFLCSHMVNFTLKFDF
jgi:hypothetical protein